MALRNVLIFTSGGTRWALELRWVREVISINALTPVPSAPPVIIGALNFRGAIVPLVGAPALYAPHPAPEKIRTPRTGDQAVLVDVEGTRAALPADRIDEVSSLEEAPRDDGDGVTLGEVLLDGKGKRLPLIDPPAVIAIVRERVAEAAARLAARLSGPLGRDGSAG